MPVTDDLVHETSSSTGSGNFTLAAVTSRQTFNNAFGTGGTDVFYYAIVNRDADEWEVGSGSMSDATTLVRDTVIGSSNADSLVTFSAGTKDVSSDLPASIVVGTSQTQTLSSKTLTSPVINTSVSGTAVLDEDNMASNSATQLATQQSIKAYADTKQTQGDVLDDLNTLGAPTTDGEFIVATGAGAFAYETGATLRTSIGVGTSDSPQFTAVNIGHATDTTITRSAAGVIQVEGDTIAMLGTAQEWTARQNFNETSLTSTTNAVAWDVSSNQVVSHTLTENTTVSAPTNAPAGSFVAFRAIQDSSGGAYTLGWNAVFKFAGGTAPTMTATNGAVDVYVFWSDGTNLYSVGYAQDLS